jgi:hypothetical protein
MENWVNKFQLDRILYMINNNCFTVLKECNDKNNTSVDINKVKSPFKVSLGSISFVLFAKYN